MKAVAVKPTSMLLICSSYPPVIGGSELEAQRVCAALIQRGHRVTVVCAGGEPMPDLVDWIDPEGVPVRIYAGHWKGTLQNIVFAARVAGMLLWERRNYQIVYFLMQGLHLAAGLPTARLLGKPILMKVGGSGVIPLMAKSVTGRLELHWLRQWAYRIMILNDGMRNEGIQEGFPASQLHWMPNPVNTDVFAPCGDDARRQIRSQFDIPQAAAVVLYVGRLAPEKALPSLIDAFAQTVQQIPDALLVLVGDGPMRVSIEQQVDRLGLSTKVCFAGRVEPANIPSWLQIADVFTLVSFSEGFACSLLEAMSVGLPAVVSDITANRQLVDSGVHGFLTPVGNAEAVASGIVSLLQDSPLRTAMGQAARQRVIANYSTDKIADRYEELLGDALSSVKTTRPI